ncbi:hypothetical protein J437_LFUL015485 [Ladona fulva]|uniref:Aminopeptidase N n=1 Tax=Ladona fulva TaxID=123851 RepID=A0A8K0KH79_LADFU|nr:hypothetical protein J437_LFUL015485 [Ladona fulva]
MINTSDKRRIQSCANVLTLINPMAGMTKSSLAVTILVVSSLTSFSCAGSSGESDGGKFKGARLPSHMKPIHYRIRLMPFIWPGNFTTAGELDVLMECLLSSHNVTLNAKEIDVLEDSVHLFEADGENNLGREIPLEPLGKYESNSTDQEFVIETSEELKAGSKYRVQMRFIAKLNDLLQGFYRSSYEDATTGEKRWLAVTQFSPVDARRSYPCFDEPALKATFEVSLARTLNMSSRSNMPLERSEPIEGMPGWVWDHYPTTLQMSTYLTAFLVSDFEPLQNANELDKLNGSLQFNVWSRPDAINQTKYASEISPSILHYYEQYFDIPFPLPKLDMVAVPDFGFNAMENWGLITFRESAMLFDPSESRTKSKQNIASTIGHELGHQWFGNLVTPAWWDDLWLKEGFASYLMYIGVEHVEPTWKFLDQFPFNVIQEVFFLDSLESSHPISVEVNHPDQIREIFDSISYDKGASIIRMMNHFLGEKTFRAGLTSYLKVHGYANAVQNDLWESLTTQAHLDGSLPANMTVREVMDTWTLQTGYPVVTVTRDYESGSTSFSQERFLLFHGENGTRKENSSEWWIPISYTTQDDPDFTNTMPSIWLRPNEEEPAFIHLSPGRKWILVNIQETGFYRVNYDTVNWKLLADQLKLQAGSGEQVIPPSARSQLLDDALNLARSGLIPYSVALDLCLALNNDTNYLPWASSFKALQYLDDMLTNSPAYNLMRKLSHNLVESVGWENSSETGGDEHLKILTRVIALDWACHLGEENCISEAKQRFALWMKAHETNTSYRISPDLRGIVYCNGIKYGSTSEWEFAWQRYLDSNVGTERDVILDSLGCTREVPLLQKYLGMLLNSSSGIRKQDGHAAFATIANNPLGSFLAFDFLRNSWNDILSYYGLAFNRVAKMVASIPKYMNTPDQLAQLQQFWKDQQGNLGSTERSFKQSIEKVQANVQWMERSYEEVKAVRLMPFIWPGNFTTAGESDLLVDCLHSAHNVTLNAKEIDVLEDSVHIFLQDGENHLGKEIPLDPHEKLEVNSKELIIKTSEELKAGSKYRIQMRFIARLNDNLRGFFRSSYVDAATGETRWIAVSQFAPTDARSSFPCFDEQEYKATFEFILARTTNMTSLSNMPLDKSEPIEGMPGWVWDHYQTTPPMSISAAAYLVFDFEHLRKPDLAEEINARDSVRLNVWSRSEVQNRTEYAGEIAPLILHYFEQYFEVPYPLPKLDIVVVPEFDDFTLENWGLIIFREPMALFDPKETTTWNKQVIAMDIAHAVAHQWMGNLVSPYWWDDLWLTKCFAIYMEYVAAEYVEPNWSLLEQFPFHEIQDVFFVDALESSHPVQKEVIDPEDGKGIFENLSFAKGASLIRMLNHFLGENTFRRGLIAYFNAYGNASANKDDLWQSLTTQAHLDGLFLPTSQ